MKEEEKKFGWERSVDNFEELNKMLRIENGKIVAWWCFDCEEWVEEEMRCGCGTTLTVGQYTAR